MKQISLLNRLSKINMFCGDKNTVRANLRKDMCKDITIKLNYLKKKNNKNQVESVHICSFAFDNYHFAQARDNLAGTCVSKSSAFRNSALKHIPIIKSSG